MEGGLYAKEPDYKSPSYYDRELDYERVFNALANEEEWKKERRGSSKALVLVTKYSVGFKLNPEEKRYLEEKGIDLDKIEYSPCGPQWNEEDVFKVIHRKVVYETTLEKRHPMVLEKIKELFKDYKEKQIYVNDVGYGEEGFVFVEDDGCTFSGRSGTAEPWELINALEEIGKDVKLCGYDLFPWKAELTRRNISKEYKGKADFKSIDIVVEKPEREADLTVCLNVRPYLPPEEQILAFKNMIETTKGYLITDIPITDEKALSLLGARLVESFYEENHPLHDIYVYMSSSL